MCIVCVLYAWCYDYVYELIIDLVTNIYNF